MTNPIPENDRTEIEAAAFRRLVAHLRERTDVQNIDLMILAGFSIVVGIYPDIFLKTIIPYMNGVMGV